jgi:hypothetical protein
LHGKSNRLKSLKTHKIEVVNERVNYELIACFLLSSTQQNEQGECSSEISMDFCHLSNFSQLDNLFTC